ncbi:hypothetical protein AB0L00_10820 [Actinoallomurus sp. NPDC052308]|uniref:hypothetical protein n=1 Tax=Actinoallomurus sp. NPDC052308 TaxID=3155530 RepID=UPI00342546CC
MSEAPTRLSGEFRRLHEAAPRRCRHHGPFFRMDPAARAADLGPAARTASSVRIFFDDRAWRRGTEP